MLLFTDRIARESWSYATALGLVVIWRICSSGEFVLQSVKHLVPGMVWQGSGGPSNHEPSADKRTGVRCPTYNSRCAACTPPVDAQRAAYGSKRVRLTGRKQQLVQILLGYEPSCTKRKTLQVSFVEWHAM